MDGRPDQEHHGGAGAATAGGLGQLQFRTGRASDRGCDANARVARVSVAIARRVGKTVVVKAQVHAGGRGKAGGVKFCKTTDDVKAAAEKMLGTKMATYQSAGVALPVNLVLVTEAGGLIGNFTGEADFLEQRECVAGNPKIYGQLVGILGKYSKFASAGEKADLRQNTPNLVEPSLQPGTQIDDGPVSDD